MNKEKTEFNPTDHYIDLKGKNYLPVAARIAWLRNDHPEYTIQTECVERIEGGAIFKAEIRNGQVLLATGHKMETKQGFGDYYEKAETGAIGRALGILGYGTLNAAEFDEGTDRVVDTPVVGKAGGSATKANHTPAEEEDTKSDPNERDAIATENAVHPDETNPACPKCGQDMKLRKSSRGPFWGCSNYPECDGLRKITVGAQLPSAQRAEARELNF